MPLSKYTKPRAGKSARTPSLIIWTLLDGPKVSMHSTQVPLYSTHQLQPGYWSPHTVKTIGSELCGSVVIFTNIFSDVH